jgi:hypothetical protein
MKYRIVLSQEQITEIIEDLKRQYKKKLAEVVANKTINQKRDAQSVIELAEILEQIYVKSNQKSYVSSICTQICRDFKTSGDPHWYYVYDYLPDKYKNQQQVNNAKGRKSQTENEIAILPSQSTPTQNPLEFLANELNNLLEQVPKEQLRDAWELAGHLKEEIADKAEEAGVPLLSDIGYGSQTGEDDTKVSTVEPPQTDEEVKQIIQERRKNYHSIGDETFDEFERFWPQHKEKVPRWAEGIDAVMSIFKWLNDDKFSLEISEWFDRAGYERGHGKHAGAVWQKALTVLCKKCSANVLEDEDEYEVMFIDPTSPTGWRCPRCHGHDQFERAMTREQIGDRREYIFGFANYLLAKIPGFLDLCDWYRTYKKPYNTARKIRLFRRLSDLA